MANYKSVANANQNVHFSKAMFSEAEHSRMVANPVHLTTFNAGDIVPVYCREVLPYESLKIDLDFVIRQTTLLTPTMGNMKVDFYAFFVPNRVVNQSWKAVEGENLNGSWAASSVSLAPLVANTSGSVQIPVGSVADYYGFPTQLPIPKSVLSLCHDLKFRGYVMIWNEYFRDQNYQPPIAMSTLNVYQGFLDSVTSNVGLSGSGDVQIGTGNISTGSFGDGAVAESLYGSGPRSSGGNTVVRPASPTGRFRAISKPLKANKLHDYFTSVLPSPQKAQSSVFAPATGQFDLPSQFVTTTNSTLTGNRPTLRWGSSVSGSELPLTGKQLYASSTSSEIDPSTTVPGTTQTVFPTNLQTVAGTLNLEGIGISVNDLRMASAIQQVYEIQARGGSRYREIVQSFFGITADDPYSDIPKCLGHVSRELQLFQTAQTSASETGNTPQGNLAGFGYTASSGHLFENLFLEHGYVHILAVVRHRNIYSSFMARDNFRLNLLDFYMPPLANISEQPVYTREINPFSSNPNGGFGFQEAWAEYRYEPDLVSGAMRTGLSDGNSLAVWNYADNFDSSLQIANSAWLVSNSEQVLNRSLAVTSDVSPQFKAEIRFVVDKTLPMPTYSVPGMDII